jgi:hypothetical protein
VRPPSRADARRLRIAASTKSHPRQRNERRNRRSRPFVQRRSAPRALVESRSPPSIRACRGKSSHYAGPPPGNWPCGEELPPLMSLPPHRFAPCFQSRSASDAVILASPVTGGVRRPPREPDAGARRRRDARRTHGDRKSAGKDACACWLPGLAGGLAVRFRSRPPPLTGRRESASRRRRSRGSRSA